MAIAAAATTQPSHPRVPVEAGGSIRPTTGSDSSAAELSASKETEEGLRGEMDAAVKEEESKKSDMPSLFKEREGLRAEINKHRDEIRKLRDEVRRGAQFGAQFGAIL